MGNSTRAEDKIEELVAQHGAVPPPYFMFKDTDPYSICWRMGSGEDYILFFFHWWEEQKRSLDESQRIEYFRKWPPPPRWLVWMIEVIWDLNPEGFDEDDDFDNDNDHLEPYFKRTEALGFGGEDDYRRGCDEYAEMP